MTRLVSLSPRELALIREVLGRHPEVVGAVLFGSRAKGIARASSDVDLLLEGPLTPLQAESIANELDELPLPVRFDVKSEATLRFDSLREHIQRAGSRIHPAPESEVNDADQR
ncbi:MAG: nucleotidyltransferase domain-containing protein [Gemmatimonadota bacterium]